MLGLPENPFKAAALLLASASYIVVGVLHFVPEGLIAKDIIALNQELFVRMIPAYLPYPLALVWISGAFEILGGLGLLVPRTRRFSSWGIIALLIAVYPANINMMLNPEDFADLASPLALYIRMPFQFVFMAWVWWVARPDTASKKGI